MLPVLLNFKFLKIYTFGVFLVLSFFWGSFLLWKNVRLTSHKEEDIFDSLFASLLGALFFGRLIYVILNFNKFGFNILKFILINGYPGLSLYGAFFGGLFFLYMYLNIKKINLIETVDYFIGPTLLALAFGKIGSFFAGVDVGTKTKFLLAVKYIGYNGMRHLTAFYEGMLFFLGAYLAQKILFEVRREKYVKGFVFYFFIWFFALVYFIFDKIKENHLYFIRNSFNNIISLFFLLTSSLFFLYHFKGLIIKSLFDFTNSVKTYGHKTFKKIHSGTAAKTVGGKEKKSAANGGAKKG